MDKKMKNKKIFIDEEALTTLGLLQDAILLPVTKLMNEQVDFYEGLIKLYHTASLR